MRLQKIQQVISDRWLTLNSIALIALELQLEIRIKESRFLIAFITNTVKWTPNNFCQTNQMVLFTHPNLGFQSQRLLNGRLSYLKSMSGLHTKFFGELENRTEKPTEDYAKRILTRKDLWEIVLKYWIAIEQTAERLLPNHSPFSISFNAHWVIIQTEIPIAINGSTGEYGGLESNRWMPFWMEENPSGTLAKNSKKNFLYQKDLHSSEDCAH